jgi:hypothetical protein
MRRIIATVLTLGICGASAAWSQNAAGPTADSSEFELFMMFFVSPPAKPGKQVWALSSTSHFAFQTMDACKKFGLIIQDRLASTATTTMRGWCVSRITGLSTYDVTNPFANPPSIGPNDPNIFEIQVPKGH